MGYIGKMIALVLLRQPPPTPIPINLAPIARCMAMMQTIASHLIQSYNKVNPKWEM
jgi:hypothetical protein